MLLQHSPAGRLGRHVESIWYARNRSVPGQSRERLLPTGQVDLIVPLTHDHVLRHDCAQAGAVRRIVGPVLSGAHDCSVVRGLNGAGDTVGVHFRAGGAAAFFGGSVGELRNLTVSLDALWGQAARDLRDRLLEALTPEARMRQLQAVLELRLHQSAPARDRVIEAALLRLAARPSEARIDVIRRDLGVSPQSFIRRFQAQVGTTPKRYARVLRLDALLPRTVASAVPDWAGLAADAGYFDQSHLIHEFRLLAGLRPSEYLPTRPDQLRHVVVAVAPDQRKNFQDGCARLHNTGASSHEEHP